MSVAAKLEGFKQIWRFDNRWQLLISLLFFRHDPLLVYRLKSFEILVDHNAGDPNGPPQLFTKPMYSDHFSLISRATPLRVFDLGANSGGFPLLLAHSGFLIGQLVCVELNPSTCHRLQFNLERNLAVPASIVNAALCGGSREIRIRLGRGSVADSIYDPPSNCAGTEVVVPGRTFDELYAEHFGDELIDLCKIDVEKAEYEVFDSPGHDRLRRCRLVLIEVHGMPGRQPAEIEKAMKEMGFVSLPVGSDPTIHVFENRLLDRRV